MLFAGLNEIYKMNIAQKYIKMEKKLWANVVQLSHSNRLMNTTSEIKRKIDGEIQVQVKS